MNSCFWMFANNLPSILHFITRSQLSNNGNSLQPPTLVQLRGVVILTLESILHCIGVISKTFALVLFFIDKLLSSRNSVEKVYELVARALNRSLQLVVK